MIQSNRINTTSILSIRLLGGFHVSYQEQALNTINTARLQSLFAYLVVQRDIPLSRQHLAFLFWPDSSESQARTNLRNLLYKLRSSLPDAGQYMNIDQHTVQWQSSPHFILDVDQFVSFAGQSTSIQDLKAAVQLYAGDFMPNCYEDWAQAIRESLRQTYLNTLDKLFLLLVESQNKQEALAYAHILLREEPTREETYLQMMDLYAQQGDRASIARIYKTCVTVLERELGIEPNPATRKAYEDFISRATDWKFSVNTHRDSSPEYLFHNLPASLTSFVGRVHELEQIKGLLSKNRLVTLNGPGGIGKTRLALAAARDVMSNYRDGVFMVDLAPVSDRGMVLAAIAATLQAGDEVQSAGMDGLINLLRDQNMLLLLDNCEHLTDEAGGISLALLQACPELSILTTSRESLNTYGEIVWQVPALPTPTVIENIHLQDPTTEAQLLQSNESVELFIERATATLPTFRPNDKAFLAIGEICRQLEGMPLAIEMAAARVKTLTVHQIVQRLDNALELLKVSSHTALPRRRTMAAVIDWSYDMLTVSERDLFARLSVFSGDFSLQAAEKICQGNGIQEGQILELLASLVDKSLVASLPTLPEARFRLHEIARQYARQRLDEQGHLIDWQNFHLDYFVHFAEAAAPELRGANQLEWLNRLDLEQENLRTALSLALETENAAEPQYAERSARLIRALWMFWLIRGHFSEGGRWAERALAVLEQSESTSVALGKVLYVAASMCFFQGNFPRLTVLAQKSLHVCEAHGDAFGQVLTYIHLELIAKKQGELAQAAQHLDRGFKIAAQIEDTWLLGVLRNELGELAIALGDQEGALQQCRQALDLARQAEDKFTIIYCLTNLFTLALQQQRFQEAAMFAEESLSLSRLIGERRGIAFALRLLGRIALQAGQLQRAGELLKESLRVIWSTRDRLRVTESLVDLADYETHKGRFEVAARLLAACEAAVMNVLEGYRLENQVLFERLVVKTQAHLDSGIFTAGWTLGRLMSLEQAVHFAIVDPPIISGQ